MELVECSLSSFAYTETFMFIDKLNSRQTLSFVPEHYFAEINVKIPYSFFTIDSFILIPQKHLVTVSSKHLLNLHLPFQLARPIKYMSIFLKFLKKLIIIKQKFNPFIRIHNHYDLWTIYQIQHIEYPLSQFKLTDHPFHLLFQLSLQL